MINFISVESSRILKIYWRLLDAYFNSLWQEILLLYIYFEQFYEIDHFTCKNLIYNSCQWNKRIEEHRKKYFQTEIYLLDQKMKTMFPKICLSHNNNNLSNSILHVTSSHDEWQTQNASWLTRVSLQQWRSL